MHPAKDTRCFWWILKNVYGESFCLAIVVQTVWKTVLNFVLWFSFFPSQNQLPQINIGESWAIHHNKDLSVMIWTILKFGESKISKNQITFRAINGDFKWRFKPS